MTAEIEARYLGIDWQEPGRARRIEVDPVPIEVQREADDVLALETSLFNGHFPWLGLRLRGAAAGETPRLLTATGEGHPMMRLEAPADGEPWWVEDGRWDPERGAHLSELHRSAGTFHVAVGPRQLRINNVATGLGSEELHALLEEFRGELLGLVLEDGVATGAVAGAGGGTALAAAAATFGAALRRVLRAPATEIREGTGERPPARLRPKPATFRDHARRPQAPRLTSRVLEETVDLPETRYLRHLAGVAARLTAAGEVASASRAGLLERLQGHHRRRAEECRAMRERAVNPAIFDRQLEELERRIAALRDYGSDAVPDAPPQSQVGLRLRITNRYGRGPAFFIEKGQRDPHYAVVQVPKDLFDLMFKALRACRDYTLYGSATESNETDSKGKSYRCVRFHSVERVEPHGDVVKRKQARRERLEREGWMAQLNPKELQECRQEALAAERRTEALRSRSAALTGDAEALTAARAGLLQSERAMADLGIGLRHELPAGMCFVRDPAYAAALAAWNALRTLAEGVGLNEGLLDRIDRVGLLHASDIYEKWCLLKVMGLLIGDYRFRPPPGWQARLVEATIVRATDVSFVLVREDLGLKAHLEWQHVLPNGRRPDLVLEFRPIASGQEEEATDSRSMRGLVLDAKFRARWRPNELRNTLEELRKVKGYDGDGTRRVFVCRASTSLTATDNQDGRF